MTSTHENGAAGMDPTAWGVALASVLAEGPEARAWERRCLSTAPPRFRLPAAWAPGRPGRRALQWALDRRFAGTASHLAARKRAVRACGDGFVAEHPTGQIAVLGAGCDGTGVAWARRAPRLRVLLSDRPACIERLLRSQVGTALPPNLRFVPSELPAAVPWTHRAWDRDRPTLIVAEGLAMYLGGREVLRMLRHLRDHHRGALHVLASFLEPSLHALPRGIGAVQAYLRRTGHPGFRWALPTAGLEAALARVGLRLANSPKLPEFVDPSYGERLFVATRVVPDRPTG